MIPSLIIRPSACTTLFLASYIEYENSAESLFVSLTSRLSLALVLLWFDGEMIPSWFIYPMLAIYLTFLVPPVAETLCLIIPAFENTRSCQSVLYCCFTGVRVVKSKNIGWMPTSEREKPFAALTVLSSFGLHSTPAAVARRRYELFLAAMYKSRNWSASRSFTFLSSCWIP